MAEGAEWADENVEDVAEQEKYSPAPAKVAGPDAQSIALGEWENMTEAADQPEEKVEEAGDLDGDSSAPESQNWKGEGDRWEDEGMIPS